MQWRIWGLATAGKFFEGLVVFMTGVALPPIALEFDLDAVGKGTVGAASLLGILVGATALGGLSDHFGRKVVFIAEMGIFILFLVLVTLSNSYPMLVICLFGVGLALGCDYPTAHVIISESIASGVRGRLVLSAFAFQAVGALAGTAVGLLILDEEMAITDWRRMYVRQRRHPRADQRQSGRPRAAPARSVSRAGPGQRRASQPDRHRGSGGLREGDEHLQRRGCGRQPDRLAAVVDPLQRVARRLRRAHRRLPLPRSGPMRLARPARHAL